MWRLDHCGIHWRDRRGVIGSQLGDHSTPTASHVVSPPAPSHEPTPAEKEAEEKAKKRDVQIGLAQLGAKTLKSSMRDPDSFKLEAALVMEDGAVCYEYRARNGFGGMNRGQAVLQTSGKRFAFKSSEQPGFMPLWNRECANKSGEDVSAGINMFGL